MDYSMNLFINVVRTIFILIAGSFLHHYLNEKKIRFTRFRGRMNRKHFFLWLILLTTFHYITSSIGHMFMEQVVTLVEYWFLRITAIVVLILFTPFYLSMYIRRLHDMALVGTLGAIVTFIFLLSTCYEVVRSTSMIYNTILIILNLLLLFIPGTKYRNGFGEPDAWPRKQIKDIQAKGFLRAILDSNIEQSEKQIPIRSDINHYRKTKQVSTPKQREKMPPEILTKIKNTTNKLRTLKLSKPHMLSKLPDISKLLPKKEEKQTFIVEQLRTEPKKYASSEDIDKTIEPSKQKQRKPRNK